MFKANKAFGIRSAGVPFFSVCMLALLSVALRVTFLVYTTLLPGTIAPPTTGIDSFIGRRYSDKDNL